MEHQAYNLSVSSLSVGTWLQTLVFYFFLGLILQLIFAQLNLSPFKLRLGFISKKAAEQSPE
jgi:hypothetical protein